MTFKTDMVDDFTDIVLNEDEFAQTVAYTQGSGSAKEILAIFSIVKTEFSRQEHEQQVSKAAMLEISIDATAGIANPAPLDDTVLIDGETWTVVDIEYKGEGGAALKLELFDTKSVGSKRRHNNH